MIALRRAWHRWCYAYEMINAYPAHMAGEPDLAAEHECAAYRAAGRLDHLSIQ